MSLKTLESVRLRSTKIQAASKPTWTDEEVLAIIEHCRRWVDIKWQHQGRSKSGVDCIGLFSCVSKEIGRPITMPNNYTHHPEQRVLIDGMERLFDRVEKKEMLPGDLVLMRFADDLGRIPNRHVGLVTNLGLLHASAQFRKVTEHSLDDEWRARIEHVFRMRRSA